MRLDYLSLALSCHYKILTSQGVDVCNCDSSWQSIRWLIVFILMMLATTVNPLRYFAMDKAGMDMKQLRLRAKLRTVDVASRVGVGESSVRNWEKGRTMPKLKIDKTAALCLLYQCSIAELAQAAHKSILQADVNLAQIEISDSPEVD